MTNFSLTRGDCVREYHPVLRPMRTTVESWHARGEMRAWLVHAALAVLNGRRAFTQSSRHRHFADNAAGEGGRD